MLVLSNVLRGMKNRSDTRKFMSGVLENNEELQPALTWVLLTDLHGSKSEMRPHYTARGFDANGKAQQTVHIFADRRIGDDVFNNGGQRFGNGQRGRALDIEKECEEL